MVSGAAHVIRGDALNLPLPDGSVDLVVTSPPYFGLRSYQDGGAHYAGQIGSEATPAEFVDALIAATREMVRVLKPSGSIFINLGDKYVADNRGSSADAKRGAAKYAPRGPAGYPTGGMRQKSLMGIPWRFALRCIDELGLILRAEIVWSKPNGLPESVTDRVRRSHETWFHLVKQPRYFSAVDEIREEHQQSHPWSGRQAYRGDRRDGQELGRDDRANTWLGQNPLGKLPGSVWTIPTQPLQVPSELGVDHFAAFPMEWPRRIISGWSPSGVCTACGEGRRPVAEKVTNGRSRSDAGDGGRGLRGLPGYSDIERAEWGEVVTRTITGSNCGCLEPTAPARPSTVLDPFGGTGTAALMAKALGRIGISVDMSQDYSRLAQWRTTDQGQLAAALQMEKPQPVHPDQLDLFDGMLTT